MKDVKFAAEGVFVGKVNTTSIGAGAGKGIVLVDFVINNSIQ